MDLSKCIGCHGCEFACKNENQLPGDFRHRRVLSLKKNENVFGFLSLACNHCANPECMRVCPKRCFSKRKDGIVVHNPANCNNCQTCVSACPFNAPQTNPYTKKVSKCNLCTDRIQKGLEPFCVSACISKALKVINLSGPLSSKYHETIPDFPSVKLTKPSLRFVLPKKPRCSWRQT